MATADQGPGGLLDAAEAHAFALAMYNAVAAQQQGAIVRQAAATMVCTAILSLGVAEAAETTPQPPADAAATPPAPATPAPVAAALARVGEKVQPPAKPAADVRTGGLAYQSVAQSTAIAIQDATDYLRNMATIAATANGAALAQLLANPGAGAEYAAVLAATEQFMAGAVANFEAIGASAENVLKNFPRTEA